MFSDCKYVCFLFCICFVIQAKAEYSIDDISYWTGCGTNSAVMVVDWDDEISPESLAWGYRWNGSATGREMFDALASADRRLFLKIYPQGIFGNIVFGVGYDANNNGGSFYPGSPGNETGYASDENDHYEEGWQTQYWQYFTGNGSDFPGTNWVKSGAGFETRILSDKSWDGWRITLVEYPAPTNHVPPSECVSAQPYPRIPETGFPLSGVENWTGSGSNRAVLVVDWHNDTDPHALAWGFRWDGTATGLDMWNAVTNADQGLGGILANGINGVALSAVEYTRPSLNGELLPGTHKHDVYHSAYARDNTGTVFSAGNWSYWILYDSENCCPGDPCLTGISFTNRVLSNNSWDIWSFGTGTAVRVPGLPVAALNYPYGIEVTEYIEGTGLPYDWISGDLYTNFLTALGRPTVDTTGDGDDAGPSSEFQPVVPVYQAFRHFEIVSIGETGRLTVAFDHPVLDNPSNPYGVDFLIFGNSPQLIGGGGEWAGGNPSNVTVGSTCNAEGGEVSVSQDGVTWHTLTNGHLADDFMPTLGRVYDPANIDTNAGTDNEWWGFPTDPTIPPDPAIAASNWSGMNVAGISKRYRGSAGGSAFDITGLPLSGDINTGHKWIKYVRIVPVDAVPEIDAIADVSPLSPYQLWITDNFVWMNEPSVESGEADADGDKIPNLLEYALGGSPTGATNDVELTTRLGRATNSTDMLTIGYSKSVNASDVRIVVISTDNLQNPDWQTNDVQDMISVSEPTNGSVRVKRRIPAEQNRLFMKLRVDYE